MRKVLYARTHQSLHIPGVGDMGTVFPPTGKTLSGLDMKFDSTGLHLKFSFKGPKLEVVIPAANIILVSLAPEETIHVASGTVSTGTFGSKSLGTYVGTEDVA